MGLQEILGSRNRVKVLRALFREDGQCGRQIAARAGVAPSAGKTSLEELAATGLVLRSREAARAIHHLNRSHILAPLLGKLFAEEDRLPAHLATHVRHYLRSLATAPELLCLGLSPAGQVTLVTDPGLAPGSGPVRVLRTQLRSRFGVQLTALVTDPAAVTAAERVWSHPESAGGRVAERDRRRAMRFFGLAEPDSADPGRPTADP